MKVSYLGKMYLLFLNELDKICFLLNRDKEKIV